MTVRLSLPCGLSRWNVSVTRSDRPNAVWESLFVPGTSSSKFAFQGCSATAGAMGQNCAGPNKIAAGARLLLDTSTGKVVGEGVCCNDVTNSVASATPTNPCTPPFPHAAPPPPPPGSYHVSRLSSVIVARGVQGVSFRNMEIRYARGAGVVVDGSVNVTFVNTHIADHGMMGVNVTGGSVCAVIDSEVRLVLRPDAPTSGVLGSVGCLLYHSGTVWYNGLGPTRQRAFCLLPSITMSKSHHP
eukprot:m.785684 g.785684  ORF g.785684 m.785684 type:complete len:243 (-) comp23302_c2_seq3:205-933(-)